VHPLLHPVLIPAQEDSLTSHDGRPLVRTRPFAEPTLQTTGRVGRARTMRHPREVAPD